MKIKETTDFSFSGSVEHLPLEDAVVLVDSAGFAPGVKGAFGARAPGVSDDNSDFIASRWVQIAVVGTHGEVGAGLCHTGPRSDTEDVVAAGGLEREGARAIEDMTGSLVHDFNNLLAMIARCLGLLELQSDAAHRKTIIRKMQEAIARGALLSQQFLDVLRPRPKSIDGFVAGSRVIVIAGTLDWALRSDITVCTGPAYRQHHRYEDRVHAVA